MGIYAISLATILYLITAYSCFRQKDYPHCSMWICYALANCSLIWWEILKISK